MFWIMTALGLGCWALHTLAQERANNRSRAIRCAEIDDEMAAAIKEEIREERADREREEYEAALILAQVRSFNTIRNDRIDQALSKTSREKRINALKAMRGPDEVRSLKDFLAYIKVQPGGKEEYRLLINDSLGSEYWPAVKLLSGMFKKDKKFSRSARRHVEEIYRPEEPAGEDLSV